MTDPFSTFAAVAGIAGLAVQSVKGLIQDIEAIKDVPELIRQLKQDLLAVRDVLQALEPVTEGSSLEHLSPEAKRALATNLNYCKEACNRFQTKLKRWTRHSTEDKIHWWDRVRVGLFAERDIETLRKQLEQCITTTNTAISTTNLLVNVRSIKMTEEIKNTLLNREVELTQAMTSTDQGITEVVTRIEQMHFSNPSADSVLQVDDIGEDIEDLEAQRASLQSARVVEENLFSEIHFVRTGQKIRDVDMSDGGQLLVGLFNTQGQSGQIQQDFSNLKASKGGKGIVGVAEGLDINAFFKQ